MPISIIWMTCLKSSIVDDLVSIGFLIAEGLVNLFEMSGYVRYGRNCSIHMLRVGSTGTKIIIYGVRVELDRCAINGDARFDKVVRVEVRGTNLVKKIIFKM